uniref:hypothetical protein n=1 Tax=uncultured Thiohalocapsa sp. TaxID=768990 RepID=UPI0025F081AE
MTVPARGCASTGDQPAEARINYGLEPHTPDKVHEMQDNTTTLDPTTVRLTDITIDPSIQQRAQGLDPETVEDYRRALDGSPAWPFPPVVVYRDGDQMLLADGYHRLRAAGDCGRSEVRAEVRTGTRRE